MSDNPYSSPMPTAGSPQPKPGAELDYNAVASLCLTAGWLKFMGTLSIILGVLYCLTIVGAIFGWVPIWIGISLNRASKSLQWGYAQRSPHEIRAGMDSMALVVKIFGVLAVIWLGMIALYFVFAIVMVFVGVLSSQM